MDAESGITLFNAIAAAGKAIFEIAQGASKVEEKRRLMEVYDTLMNLKREAGNLEDENHGLKQKLRFRSEDFEFRNPFWYENKYPDRALCPKCFSQQVVAPVGEPYQSSGGTWRKCLTCETGIEEARARRSNPGPFGGRGGPNSWMA